MRICLIGADCEENLGLCMVAAAAEGAGHQIQVVPFNDICQLEQVAGSVARAAPDVVGLSIQFQHRAQAFLRLARGLRAAGYRGHITCGGQFPTMAWRELLADRWGVDSVVMHEGEATIVELLEALNGGQPLTGVPGLALAGVDGEPTSTALRPLQDDLDRLPLARRYRPHTRHMGVPFIPIMGSRGCWGRCSYCSIATLYHDARAGGGGKLLRHRGPENIAEEMALLCHAAGGSAVFCFHDDNFLLPRPEDSLRRVRQIREVLDTYGVGTVGIIGKCRPDSVTPDLARELRALGVVRLFVGVENVSPAGSEHLNRKVEVEQVGRALDACQMAGIVGCYNLLLFEPRATMADVEQNVAFIRSHASQPVNFCRVEPYSGTPLQQSLAREGRLAGSYLGYDYRIEDDQVELLFRVCAAAFRERNFAPAGVHNRYMGLGYNVNLLDRFYDDPAGVAALAGEAEALTRSIALETADFLDDAIRIVKQGMGDSDRIERETGGLALAIAEANRRRHAELDQLQAMLQAFADGTPGVDRPPARPSPRAVQLIKRVAQGAAMGIWLASWTMGCDSRTTPSDAGVDVWPVDPPPWPDMGVRPDRVDIWPVDPPPPDVGVDIWPVDPPPPPDVGVDVWPVDPPPPPPPADASASLSTGPGGQTLAGHFRDTSPVRVPRSSDLPLFDPPAVSLRAQRVGQQVRVTVLGGPEAASLRWQSEGAIEGAIEGEGREVLWSPGSDADQISVGIRARGGVAVVSLRLVEVG